MLTRLRILQLTCESTGVSTCTVRRVILFADLGQVFKALLHRFSKSKRQSVLLTSAGKHVQERGQRACRKLPARATHPVWGFKNLKAPDSGGLGGLGASFP